MTPCPPAPPELREQTLVLVKPDAVQRRLVGDVIGRFERRGFKLVAMKLLQVPALQEGGGWGVCMDPPWASPHHPMVPPGGSGPPGPALPALTAEALLPRAPGLHDLGAAGGHGEQPPSPRSVSPHCGAAGLSRPHPAGVGGLQRGALHACHGGGYGFGAGSGGDHPGGPQHARQQVRAHVGGGLGVAPGFEVTSPSLRRNVVHASDSVETALREIGFWFQRDELVAWESGDSQYTYGP